MSADTPAPPGGPESSGDGAPFDFGAVFRVVLIVVPIGVLGNLIFTFVATDRDVLRSLDEFPREWLLVALGLALLPWLTNTLRLLIWTRFLGERVGFVEAFRMTLAVDLGASVSPTAVGGGFMKWGMLVERGVTPGAAASVTALPIIEDAIFFTLALPAAVILTAAWEVGTWQQVAGTAGSRGLLLVGIAAIVFLGVVALLQVTLRGALGETVRRMALRGVARTRRRLRSAWADARDVFALIRVRGKAWFALSMTLTAAGWIARYSVITALLAFLGAPVDPVLFWALQWVVFTLMSLMPTPGATGGAEVAFAVAYGGLIPAGILGVATAGWRFLTFYLQIGLAAVLFPLLGRLQRRRAVRRPG